MNELTIPIEEKAFTLEEAFEMDELFLTSTTSEVMPITKIDGRTIGNGKPGPMTIKLARSILNSKYRLAVVKLNLGNCKVCSTMIGVKVMAQLVKLLDYISRYENDLTRYPYTIYSVEKDISGTE